MKRTVACLVVLVSQLATPMHLLCNWFHLQISGDLRDHCNFFSISVWSLRGGRVVRWCWVIFQCRGVLLIWIVVGQGPTALAVGAGGDYLDIFSLVYHFSFLSPSLWETAQYKLKYCLKWPLSPKQASNQPTNLYDRQWIVVGDLSATARRRIGDRLASSLRWSATSQRPIDTLRRVVSAERRLLGDRSEIKAAFRWGWRSIGARLKPPCNLPATNRQLDASQLPISRRLLSDLFTISLRAVADLSQQSSKILEQNCWWDRSPRSGNLPATKITDWEREKKRKEKIMKRTVACLVVLVSQLATPMHLLCNWFHLQISGDLRDHCNFFSISVWSLRGGRVVRWCWVIFQCRGVLLIWIVVGQGPTALAVGAGGDYLDIFSLVYHFSFLSPSLWETAQYKLKYCLKWPLSPKQASNQPTNLYDRQWIVVGDLSATARRRIGDRLASSLRWSATSQRPIDTLRRVVSAERRLLGDRSEIKAAFRWGWRSIGARLKPPCNLPATNRQLDASQLPISRRLLSDLFTISLRAVADLSQQSSKILEQNCWWDRSPRSGNLPATKMIQSATSRKPSRPVYGQISRGKSFVHF